MAAERETCAPRGPGSRALHATSGVVHQPGAGVEQPTAVKRGFVLFDMHRLRPRRLAFLFLSSAAVAAVLVLFGGPPGAPDRAEASEPLRANSICEAQKLKAQKAENPGLEIEIPPEYDKPFPSLSACESHDLAWDEDAPGPNQPIPFSHAHHAGEYEIPCLYCHAGTDRSRMAGVPSVELCMGCHEYFSADYDELEGIRILKQHWEEKTTIPWVQIHRLPEHAKFRHNRHLQAGLDCSECHGAVEEEHKLYLDESYIWWRPILPPTQKLMMGWCINCHRQNEVSQDCLTCHY